MISRKRAIISDEPDEKLESKLASFLSRIGARKVRDWGGVAGSVDLEAADYAMPDGRTFTVERDNWIALAIEGDASAVDEIGAGLR